MITGIIMLVFSVGYILTKEIKNKKHKRVHREVHGINKVSLVCLVVITLILFSEVNFSKEFNNADYKLWLILFSGFIFQGYHLIIFNSIYEDGISFDGVFYKWKHIKYSYDDSVLIFYDNVFDEMRFSKIDDKFGIEKILEENTCCRVIEREAFY